jgi:nitrite reductase/ring-hydroxylating ferredoxin subunit
LSSAIKTGHFNCIESLLDAGIDVNGEYCTHKNAHAAQFSFTKTALISAIHKGRFNIVKLLVSRGARVNPLQLDDDDNLFRYPLFHALNRDNPEMVELLLELGADPNK